MPDFSSWLQSIGDYAIGSALPAIILLAAGILLVRIIISIVNKVLTKVDLEIAAHKLIKASIRAVLYVLLGLIVADKLGIDVTGVVALASVLTLAISLSIQNALTNLISGFTLLHTHPFSSGDYVEIAGQSGTVLEISLTYTKLATADNKSVYIPNSAVTSAEIVNYTVLGTRRVSTTIAVSYDAPTELVLEALLEAGDVPTRLEDKPPFAAMSSYGDHAIHYVLHVWSTTGDYWTTQFAVNEKIRKVFNEKGISMTYPHLNVHLDK